MKTPWEATAELWSACDSDVGAVDVAIAIKARDAEHAAQLAAAERTIEQLGQDAAAIAGRLEIVESLLRMARINLPADSVIAAATDAALAPAQPEPAKVPRMCACHMEEHMVCDICQGVVGEDVVPENVGTTCSACKGWAYQGKGTK